MDLKKHLKDYIYINSTGWSNDTITSIRSILNRYVNLYTEMNRPNVAHFFNDTLSHLSPKSVSDYSIHLYRFAEYLAEEDIIPFKQYKQIRKFAKQNRAQSIPGPRSINNKNFKKILDLLQQFEIERHMYLSGYYLGTRAEEITLLKLKDFKPELGHYGGLYVRGKGKGKTKKVRLLAFTYESRKWFDGYLQYRSATIKNPNDEYLFPSKRGSKQSRRTVHLIFKRITDIAHQNGILRDRKITCHDLRHTCSKKMRQLQFDNQTIQKYLGHSTINVTTDVYLHLSEDEYLDEFKAK